MYYMIIYDFMKCSLVGKTLLIKNFFKYIHAYMHVIIEKVINGEQKWS